MNGHAHEDELLVVNQENGPVPKETGQSNLLIPNNINGVPLTPSSSGYASETWKSTAEPVFIFAIHSKPVSLRSPFFTQNSLKTHSPNHCFSMPIVLLRIQHSFGVSE